MKEFITWFIQLMLVALSLTIFYFGFSIVGRNAPVSKVPVQTWASDTSLTATKTEQVDSSGKKQSDKKVSSVIIQPRTLPTAATEKELYDTAYNYFILSALIMIVAYFLPRIQSLALPGGATLQLREELKAVKEQANALQEASVEAGGRIHQGGAQLEELKQNYSTEKMVRATASASHDDDPQKGRWGGFNKRNGRELTAQVSVQPNLAYYDIVIQVKSTSASNPLTGNVKFHLHNTFANPNPIINAENGVAELKLIAWGAFTVGAEADNGSTRLELDLAKLHDAPEQFKQL